MRTPKLGYAKIQNVVYHPITKWIFLSDEVRKEHAAFQFHKAVVRHGFRKIRLHRTLNKEQVVVLEIAECTEMEIQQNRHDFTVG